MKQPVSIHRFAEGATIDLLPLAQFRVPDIGATGLVLREWLSSLGWYQDPNSRRDPYESWTSHSFAREELEKGHSRADSHLCFFDSAVHRESNLELQRRLLARGWMCPWPDQVVGGQTFSAPSRWILAGADLPWRGGIRLGTKWRPEHGRSFVSANGRVVRGGEIQLKTAVRREGLDVQLLHWKLPLARGVQ